MPARIELSYRPEAPVYQEIERLAAIRQTTMQQIVYSILVDWYNLKQGVELGEDSVWSIRTLALLGAPEPRDESDDDAGTHLIAQEYL